jgi:signal transduction histidine kinase
VWHLAVTAPHPLPSVLRGLGTTVALVLVVVGVSGWLTARGLVGPLARLSRAARAFGAGDLKARAALDRSDELGDVSAAFDEMAEQVTRALRAEKELLANVSHELRTPLQRIQIAIDLAAEGDAATARESLDEIAEDLAELGRIVEEVLAAARLSLRDGGNGAGALLPIHRAPTDLIALLHKSAARFHALHASRPIHVDVTAALPTILVDAVLVRRAMDNLLDNAHKYTDETDAPIMLSATREGETIAIEIRDTGIGISADDRARLFEPFFRADRSRARSTGGLGLGLLLAKRIVEAHGGTLTVKSVSRAGTTARIELPVEHVAVAS